MKIEKVNDHQIRCTLTHEDLASRALKMSELAYGSQKAKDLFRDMMEKANDEYGFEAENSPLMIEAIPLNGECIVLVITKVEDPEELDTRFSKFAPGLDTDATDGEEDSEDYAQDAVSKEADSSIADLFRRFKDAVSSPNKEGIKIPEGAFDGMAFCFASITDLASVCAVASSFFTGNSSVYRNTESGEYLLTLNRRNMDVSDFVQTCNMLSEYGAPLRGKSISESYLREHFEPIVLDMAVETLAEIG